MAVDVPGVVRDDELYTRAELCRRLGWRQTSLRKARRSGLPIRQHGRSDFILGRDVIAYFSAIEPKPARG